MIITNGADCINRGHSFFPLIQVKFGVRDYRFNRRVIGRAADAMGAGSVGLHPPPPHVSPSPRKFGDPVLTLGHPLSQCFRSSFQPPLKFHQIWNLARVKNNPQNVKQPRDNKKLSLLVFPKSLSSSNLLNSYFFLIINRSTLLDLGESLVFRSNSCASRFWCAGYVSARK